MKHPVSVARRATAAAAARLLAAPTRARQIAAAGGHARGRTPLTRSQALAFVGVLMMIGTLVAPVGGAIAAPASSSGPPGLEKAPSDNFRAHQSAGPPSNALENVPTHAAAWDVHASAHAEDLETTVDATGDQLKLILADYRNHEGREVAIAASALEDSLGERPEIAYGVHESGERWSSEIEYRDGYGIITVPHFSENEITFSGSVELTGSPAADGASYKYDLADSEDASNFSVELTGVEHRKWDNVSAAGVTDSDTVSVNPAGNLEPTGPSANGEPTIEITGELATDWSGNPHGDQINDIATDTNGYTYTVSSDGTLVKNTPSGGVEWTYSLASSGRGVAADDDGSYAYVGTSNSQVIKIDSTGSVAWNVSAASDAVMDVEVDDAGNVYLGSADNTVRMLDSSGTEQWSFTGHSDVVRRVAVEPDGSAVYSGSQDGTVREIDSTGTEQWSFTGSSTWIRGLANDPNGAVFAGGDDNVVWQLDSTGSAVWTSNDFGKSVWSLASDEAGDVYAGIYSGTAIKLEPGSGEEWSKNVHSSAISGMDVREQQRTVFAGDRNGVLDKVRAGTWDPAVDIDGDGTNEATVSGWLEATDTVVREISSLSLSDDAATISTTNGTAVDLMFRVKEGTISVDPTVSVNGDNYQYAGTLSDGETTTLDVSTTSLKSGENVVNVSVSPDSGGPVGQVGLDYSHTATDAQSVDYEGETFSERYNVSKTYASDRTGETLSIPWSGNVIDVRNLELRRDGGSWTTPTYSLTDGVLEVEIGSVSEGETVEVRTTGTKVQTRNGAITVVDPTVLGEDLSSKIQIDEYSSGFELEVSGTVSGNSTHYTHSESWSNPQTHARVGSDGSQELRFPNAGAGETARISTIALEPQPQDGHIDLRVRSAGSEPEFEVLDSSSTSEVELVWHDTVSGHVYQLYSLDADRERDRGEASSPVSLTHDGTAEVLQIIDLGTSGSGSGGGGPRGSADGGILTGPITMIIAVTAALSGLYLLSRRTGDDSVSARFIIMLAVPIIGAVAIFALAPQIWSDELASALGDALPLIAMFAAVGVYLWYRAARSPDEQVTLQIGDR